VEDAVKLVQSLIDKVHNKVGPDSTQ
jgi:hypothetical protein